MRVSILFTDPATRRATLRQAAAGDRARPFEYSRRRRRLVHRADAAKVPMAPRLNILPRARMRAYGHVQIAELLTEFPVKFRPLHDRLLVRRVEQEAKTT